MNEMCTAFERRLFLIITIVYVKAHMSVRASSRFQPNENQTGHSELISISKYRNVLTKRRTIDQVKLEINPFRIPCYVC